MVSLLLDRLFEMLLIAVHVRTFILQIIFSSTFIQSAPNSYLISNFRCRFPLYLYFLTYAVQFQCQMHCYNIFTVTEKVLRRLLEPVNSESVATEVNGMKTFVFPCLWGRAVLVLSFFMLSSSS